MCFVQTFRSSQITISVLMLPNIWAVERNIYPNNGSPTTGNPRWQGMDHSLRIQAKAKLKRDCRLIIFSLLQVDSL